MTDLEEQLEQASVRSYDRVTATITDVEFDPVQGDVLVHYLIGTGEGDLIESIDRFPVPETNDEREGFVTLCREAGVSLADAQTELVDEVVDVASENDEWYLAANPNAPTNDSTETATTVRGRLKRWGETTEPIVYALVISIVLVYPLFAPVVGWWVFSHEYGGTGDLFRAVFWAVVGGVFAGVFLWLVGFTTLRWIVGLLLGS
ncbi:hypothetical protein [Halopiger goleimassiliensis]|uniref:hypothetical protein n=1 Tax=Halopiger goleimassiliensis TaxID=1293048 RepID=UPI000677E953|nr:hypothetical protein [Halopiger goleimassiliensis]